MLHLQEFRRAEYGNALLSAQSGIATYLGSQESYESYESPREEATEETAVEYTLFTKLAAEFVGTAVLMVFGNGAVANAELKNTKGQPA